MRKLGLIFLVLVVLIVACGGGGDDEKTEEEAPAEASAAGDAAKGELLFSQTLIGSQPGCVTCHSLEPDQVLVGPSMAGIAGRAAARVAGKSAEAYLRESIANPDAYTVEGFAAGVMPAALADELSASQTNDLVAYLLTLQ
jgi:cytochrome c2